MAPEVLGEDPHSGEDEALRATRETLLLDAYARLRQHIESTPLALVEWDGDYRVRGYSRRAEEMFGFSPEEVVGKRIDEIPWIPESDWPSVRAVMHTMWTAERTTNVNANRNRRKDGSLLDCEWYNSALHDAAGRLVSVLSLVLDVTDRTRAAEERERLTAQRQLALDAANLGWFSLDGRTGVATHDRRYAEIFGVTGPVASPRREILRLLHPDDRARAVAALDAALDPTDPRPAPYAAEYRVIRPDGALRWVEAHGIATFEGQGPGRRLASFVGTVADVTARKELERSLREADQRKDEFLAVLSHELRNPLAPIRNALFVLDRAAPGSDAAARARAALHRQTEHLARLVDDLLDVARIGGGKIELRRSRVDARELARRTADDLLPLFEQRGVALHLRVAEPVWVDADPARLSQVIGNLLQNGLKFTPPGGRVELSAAAGGGRCRIAVRDTGVGIAPEDLDRIFAPFVQASRTRGHSQDGLGLGLSLVRELAALHGGEVRASSPGVGRGAEFVLELPQAPAPPADLAPAPATARPAAALSVLVVEDNDDAGATLVDLLGLAGHGARRVRTGGEAVAAVAGDPPDALICDIGLPDMSGHAVIRALRATPAGAGVFAVALTGYAQPQDREEALRAGFDGHLAKPPDLPELMRLLEQAAERRRAAREG